MRTAVRLFYRLLEGAVGASPRTYRSLVTGHASGRWKMPVPPSDKRVRSESLAGERRDRPWRSAAERGIVAAQ